ncbi:MAG: matrixin family metalloprotease [Planctomycetes bacterium]|nr:matrixin family metalloprotease [Planctomycetota bacterium]
MRSTRSLQLEQLEDRCVPATWGNPWPDGAHLTLSFAPDGTAIGDRMNLLSRALNGTAPTAAWQREILGAFQTWAVQANLNIGLVADSGDPLGAAGRPQGDPRFGDIRVAGYAMSPEVMALTSPFEVAGGTWSGDVKLNTAYDFALASQGNLGAGDVDLFTVFLHEAGHAFGLDHSLDPASVMEEGYSGLMTGLSASDIAHIQALYGARSADRFEGAAGNDQMKAASTLSLLSQSDGVLGLRVEADITSIDDVDYHKFTLPLNPASTVVTLQTSGLSLLTPRLTVYDASGRVVGTSVGANPGQDLTVSLNQLKPLATYYIKVEGAVDDVFGIGGYQLQVRSSALLSNALATVNQGIEVVGGVVDDLHTNDTMLTASLLPLNLSQTDSRFEYAFKGNIRDSWDVDYYRIQASTPPKDAPNVMTVMVWGTQNNGLIPKASVFDAKGNPVGGQIVVNDNGVYTLQIANAAAGAAYFVKIEAQNAKTNNVGAYFLGIDFSTKTAALASLVQQKMSAPQLTTQLDLDQSRLFHFVLAANSSQAVTLFVTVKDAQGNVLAQRCVQSGQTISFDVYLPAGSYQIQFTTVGAPPADLSVQLWGLDLDDPIGPRSEDPTNAPFTQNSSSSPSSGTKKSS